MATPGDNIGQQGEYHNDGEVPRPGQKGVDLGASMNSAVTTTTSATDEDDESQDGGAPPGFDYYGMTSQPVSTWNSDGGGWRLGVTYPPCR